MVIMEPLFLKLKVINCSVDLLEKNDMLLQPVRAEKWTWSRNILLAQELLCQRHGNAATGL